MSIIGIGIMALIAMVTATESLKENIKQEFSSLGTNTFSISMKTGGRIQQGLRAVPTDPITYENARLFAESLDGADITVSASILTTGNAILTRGTERTNQRSDSGC